MERKWECAIGPCSTLLRNRGLEETGVRKKQTDRILIIIETHEVLFAIDTKHK